MNDTKRGLGVFSNNAKNSSLNTFFDVFVMMMKHKFLIIECKQTASADCLQFKVLNWLLTIPMRKGELVYTRRRCRIQREAVLIINEIITH